MPKPPLKIISAMTSDRVIGCVDGMPWDVPDEFQHFLDSVAGETVLFGRTSYEIFKAELTSAHAVVLSRSKQALEGALVFDSFEAGLAAAREFGKTVWCCGGAQVYEQSIPHADEMLLSTIKGTYEGTAYFPEFDESQWRVAELTEHDEWTFRRWVRA